MAMLDFHSGLSVLKPVFVTIGELAFFVIFFQSIFFFCLYDIFSLCLFRVYTALEFKIFV